MRRVLGRVLAGLALTASPALAQSQAAFLRAAEQAVAALIEEGCEGQGGRLAEGLVVRDLDGDGASDLLLGHDGLTCNPPMVRSGYCGMQVCTTKLLLWRNDRLVEAADLLGTLTAIDEGSPPVLRWNGAAFAPY